ncbi:MAG: DNA repair protein [Clostridia bacterium]|nr:DNA repair protein [Clostridia bacterium]
MVNKELKRLSRRELVDIIYQLKKNEQEMQAKIDSLNKELEDKQIRISNAGSIADAAISITNVFSDAQTTADIYLKEVATMKEKTEKEC